MVGECTFVAVQASCHQIPSCHVTVTYCASENGSTAYPNHLPFTTHGNMRYMRFWTPNSWRMDLHLQPFKEHHWPTNTGSIWGCPRRPGLCWAEAWCTWLALALAPSGLSRSLSCGAGKIWKDLKSTKWWGCSKHNDLQLVELLVYGV